MATDVLVGNSLQQGKELLQALDQANFPVSAAMWYQMANSWRYVIASSVVDSDGPREAYRRVNDIVRSSKIGVELSEIAVVGSQEPLVQLLRTVVTVAPRPDDVGGLRFDAKMISHVHVEDAYIYRMA